MEVLLYNDLFEENPLKLSVLQSGGHSQGTMCPLPILCREHPTSLGMVSEDLSATVVPLTSVLTQFQSPTPKSS